MERNLDMARMSSRTGLVLAVVTAAGLCGCVGRDNGFFITGSTAIASDNANSSLYGNYLAARHAGRNRDTDAATVFYSRALEQDPENREILLRTFLLELSAGNIGKAASLSRKVLLNQPDNRAARMVLALQAFSKKDYAKAREWLISNGPAEVSELAAILITAWTWQGEGNSDKALETLKKLEDTPAFNYFQSFHSALIANLDGRDKLAHEEFESAYELSGGSLRAVQAFGLFEEKRGRNKSAMQLYEDLLKRHPQNPMIKQAVERIETGGIPPHDMVRNAAEGAAEALYSIASQLSKGSGADLARIYLQLALYIRPDFSLGHLLLADIYENQKNTKKALSAYDEVNPGSPLRMEADILAAISLDRLDKTKEAEARLKQVIARYPDKLRPIIAMGNMLRGRQKYEQAEPYYSQAIKMVGQPEKEHWRLYYSRGVCFERMGQWSNAEADLKKALKLNPEQPLVLNYLGYSWIERRRFLPKAMQMIRKAVDLRPNDGFIIDSLGWAHYQLGNWKEAVKNLERAVELQPDDPVINDHLGDAYWQVGRELEARFQWSHAKEMKPDAKVLARIEEKLKNGLEKPKRNTAAVNVRNGG